MTYRDELESQIKGLRDDVDSIDHIVEKLRNGRRPSYWTWRFGLTIFLAALIGGMAYNVTFAILDVTVFRDDPVGNVPEADERTCLPAGVTFDDAEECSFLCKSWESTIGYDEERGMVSCTCFMPNVIDLSGELDD